MKLTEKARATAKQNKWHVFQIIVDAKYCAPPSQGKVEISGQLAPRLAKKLHKLMREICTDKDF